MPDVHEQLSAQFQRWETRGRGWQVFSEPVVPEPPFRPFLGHYLSETAAVDDGRRPTFLSSLTRRIGERLSTKPPPSLPAEAPEEEPKPQRLVRESLVEFQTFLPAELDIPREACEQFLRCLSAARDPIAFEIVGTRENVAVQFAAHPDDAALLHRQLESFFPQAAFRSGEGHLLEAWDACQGENALVIEFGLAREFMLSLSHGNKLDPFVGLVGALSTLAANELGLFQVLWQKAEHPWREHVLNSVRGRDGRPFFVNRPELASAAEAKTASPLFAAVIRVLVLAGTFDRAVSVARDLAGSLAVFSDPEGNELIPLTNDEYPLSEHIEDTLRRQSRRSGMLLNGDEIVGFVHLPGNAVRSALLSRDSGTTKAAPQSVKIEKGLLLGENTHAGQTVEVRLSPSMRVTHTHIIGASGAGKSTLLFNLIRQDMEKGDGVAVLDPHGDLIDRLLGVVPESRIDDVILFDPSDSEYPVGFNILSAHSDQEKTLLASDLVSVFRRLSSSWGDQMDMVFQNAVLAFLESTEGGTLSDLRRFLIEPGYRQEFLSTVNDSEIIYYWQKVFPQLSGNRSVGSIVTRLQEFLSRKPIRNVVSQKENRLDFARVMDEGKIFLARLPEGLLGAENSYLLGTLLVAKFQQIVMARQAQAASLRRDYWLYIDECDCFMTPTMAEILKGARKYRLGLTLAHQELQQLKKDLKVESAVLTHPSTRIVFRVSDDDARKLADGFSSFDAASIRNLEKFHAIARVDRSDHDFNLKIRLPEPVEERSAEARRREVITASRDRFAGRSAAVTTDSPGKSPHPLGKETQAAMCPVPDAARPSSVTAPLPSTQPDLVIEDLDAHEKEHTRIKERIAVEADALDYTPSPEERLLSGGRVDVVLRRGAYAVACEVSVTNSVEYEVHNALKCLQAGFARIAVICRDQEKLAKIKDALKGTPGAAIHNVGFYSPEEFLAKLFDWAADDPAGGEAERGKPRKRKIGLGDLLSSDERKMREEAMLAELRRAMKRPGGAT